MDKLREEFEERYPRPANCFFECGEYRAWPGDGDEDEIERYQDLWSSFLDGAHVRQEIIKETIANASCGIVGVAYKSGFYDAKKAIIDIVNKG